MFRSEENACLRVPSLLYFFFSSRRRHTRLQGDWSSDVCSSDLFGEEGADLSAPGPLIRVREGTTIVLTLRNALASTLRVEGLCARPGPCNPVSVAPGASQEIRFDLDADRKSTRLNSSHLVISYA